MKYSIMLLSIISLPLYAQTMGILHLRGEIASIMSVVVVPEPIANALPLTQSQTDLKVATINERSNHKTGYSIHISSENQGKLVKNEENIPYTMKYNGSNVNIVTGQSFSHNFTNTSVKSRDLNISYTSDENLSAGIYTDNITVTISAN